MLNITIFSKNRACQLDLLLRSIKRFFQDWRAFQFNLLYTYDSDFFAKGYEILKKEQPEFNYVKEKDFKTDVINLVSSDKPYTMFYVDDNVYKRPFSILCLEFKKFKETTSIVTLSLRMDPGIQRCYTMNLNTPPPKFIEHGLWEWRGQQGDWGYPMSIDGSIFRTQQLLPLLLDLPYNSPNTMEGVLANRPINLPYMLCFQESVVINIPANKVQNDNNNRHGNITAEYLNREYVSGKRIQLESLLSEKYIAPHHEVSLLLE